MDESNNWKQYLFKGALAYHKQEFRLAQPLLRQSPEEKLDHSVTSSKETLPVVLENLALVLLDQGKFGRAESVLKRALSLVKNRQSACRLTYKLAQLYLLQGKFSLAERFTAGAITLGEACPIRNPEMEALQLTKLAKIWNSWGQHQSAIETFYTAQEMRRDGLFSFDCTPAGPLPIAIRATYPVQQFAEFK